MQTASAALAAAITAPVRRPVATCVVDWPGGSTYDTLTPVVESVSITRTLTTDLPAETGLVSGYAAAQCDVALAGDVAGVPVNLLVSQQAGYLTQRVSTPVAVTLGMVGSAGAEYLPAFVGRVRAASVDSGDRGVTLTAIDGSELLRTTVTLPVFAADAANTGSLTTYQAPGLSAQWVMDYVARANGYRMSPVLRAQAVLAATMHGSAWPEVGTLLAAFTYNGSTHTPQGAVTFAPHSSGALGIAGDPAATAANSSQALYSLASPLSVNQGALIYYQCRVRMEGTPSMTTIMEVANATSGATDRLLINVQSGGVVINLVRNGAADLFTIAAAALTVGADHMLGVHVTMTSTGCTVQVNVDGTAYSGSTVLVGSPTGRPSLLYGRLWGFSTAAGTPYRVIVSAEQITTEAYSAGMFDNAFQPTAVMDQSLNPLTVMPAVEDATPWDLLVEVAEAEGGVVLVDESGVLRFYNAARMTDAGTPAVALLSTSRALTAARATEAVDGVRNVVRVPASPLILDPVDVLLWSLSETVEIPANGSVVLSPAFDGPVVVLDTSVAYGLGPGSYYRAALYSDGTGGNISNLTFSVTQFPARALVVVSNPNATSVFLVNNSAATGVDDDQQGRPWFTLAGRLGRAPQSAYVSRADDLVSQAQPWGVQSMDVPESRWRQSQAASDSLAASLVAKLAYPVQLLDGVEVVGDMRVQLADPVTIIDQAGTGVIGDYWLVGKTDRLDVGSGYTQSLQVRRKGWATLGMTGTFTLDDPVLGIMDALNGLG